MNISESSIEQRESICNYRHKILYGSSIIHKMSIYKIAVLGEVVYVTGKCSTFNNSIFSKAFIHTHAIDIIDIPKNVALDKNIILHFETDEFKHLLKYDRYIKNGNINKIPSLYDFCMTKLSVYPEIMLQNIEHIPLHIRTDYTVDPTVIKYLDDIHRIKLIENNLKI